MHNIEAPHKQGIRITHKTNETSEDNNIYQAAHRSVRFIMIFVDFQFEFGELIS